MSTSGPLDNNALDSLSPSQQFFSHVGTGIPGFPAASLKKLGEN